MRRVQGQIIYDEPSVAVDDTPAALDTGVLSYLEWSVPGPLDSWRYQYVKRALDIACSLLLIVVLFIPGLLIAACIYLTTPYPVFYNEERIGRGGVPFRIWKFRSMRPHILVQHSPGFHSEGTVLQWRISKHGNDPRITPIGRFLRRWSVDELPQLYNVLRGEMSLIGPRPVVKAEAYLYKHLLPFYLAATPGLSGLWQVSGRSDLDYDERARLDAKYVNSWSLRSDLSIFFRTIPAVLRRVGAR
jgi:exopolysaccharide production protein ExoY